MNPSFSLKFLLSLLLCVGGGILTGFFTQYGLKEWYPTLVKSSGTPPNFVFPVVWTVLYAMMALSLALVWDNSSKKKLSAYLAFFTQLFLNFIWSWLFFYLRRPDLSLIDIFALWLSIGATIYFFSKHSRLASLLLIPYLIWVSYAAYLNFFIYLHN